MLLQAMNAHCFVDGGYLRALSKQSGKPLVDPRLLANNIAYSGFVQLWRTGASVSVTKDYKGSVDPHVGLSRVIYYDARPDKGADPLIEKYWEAIELLPETEVGFGALRGRPRRQKRVDGLIAVDMLSGVFSGLYGVAILVAGDSDFVPIVDAARNRGAMVVVAAEKRSLSLELKRAADRVWDIDPDVRSDFPPLCTANKQCWYESNDGSVELHPE